MARRAAGESLSARGLAIPADVIVPDPHTPMRRRTFAATATHVGVSPDGGRLYLLDSHRNTVRAFRGPNHS